MAENIRKKGSTYSYRINMKDPDTGKWRTIEKSGFKTIAEAKAAMAARRAEIIENPESILVKDKPITVEQVYTEFIGKRKNSRRLVREECLCQTIRV